MSRGPLQKYLPVIIVLAAALIGGLLVAHTHLEALLPCSLVKTEGVPWGQMNQKQRDCVAYKNDQENKQEIEAGKQAEIDSKNWPEYRDQTLGVAIRHPETSDSNPIVFFQAGNILFVRTTKSLLYSRRSELPKTGDDAILAKVKEIAAASSDSADYDRTWEIRVFDVSSDTDLQKIIDSKFGPNRCLVSSKKLSSETDVYDVALKDKFPPADPEDELGGSCSINWVFHLKYSPTLHRAAMWDIGQDARFPYKGCSDLICSADFPMADSFSFI